MSEAWWEQARIRRLGPRHELAALPGYGFRPRKYSVEGDEAVSLAQVRLQERFRPETMRRVLAKARGANAQSVEDVLRLFDENDLVGIIEDASDVAPGVQIDYKRQVLLQGIGEHDFGDAEGRIESVTEAFVNRILEDAELTDEMVAVIVGWNRPLAAGSDSKSETSSNGSIEGSSPRKAKSTPTGASPAS